MRGCLLRWKPVEVPSTWERPPLGFPQKFTCPRMSVGYAGVLPIRGQAPAYRTTLLGIRSVSPLKRETSFGRMLNFPELIEMRYEANNNSSRRFY